MTFILNRRNKEAVKNARDRKTRKRRIFPISLAVLALTVLISIYFYTDESDSNRETIILTDSHDAGKYDVLVHVWNKYAIQTGVDDQLYLREFDVQENIRRLNEFLNPFYKTIPKEVESELRKLRQENKYSFFNFYYDFVTKYKSNSPVKLNPDMSSKEIRKIICKITQKNEIEPQTIRIVASMNSLCYFFHYRQKSLYLNGLDRRIRSCEDISIDRDKYPKLYHYIFESERS